ncbi:hypothetical protein V8V91_16310 [Algoriphagus halophilus]|uniref:hypothetical protein n=1 Tax=Algoriphagus halophilus TaxID=226505 RepID=UPI0035900158
MDKKDHSENIFQTFTYDLEQLRIGNPNFSPQLLTKIKFQFDQNESGVVILDQLGITKKINL